MRAEKLGRKRNQLRAPERIPRAIFFFQLVSLYSNYIHNNLATIRNLIIFNSHQVLDHRI